MSALRFYCTAQYPDGPDGAQRRVFSFVRPCTYPMGQDGDTQREYDHVGEGAPPVSWQPNEIAVEDWRLRGFFQSASHAMQWRPVCGVCAAPVKEVMS